MGIEHQTKEYQQELWESFEYSVLLEALVKSSKRCLFFKATSKVLKEYVFGFSKELRKASGMSVYVCRSPRILSRSIFSHLSFLETKLQKDIISSKQTLCSQKFVVETIPLCLIWINHNETYIYTWALVCRMTNTKLPPSFATL